MLPYRTQVESLIDYNKYSTSYEFHEKVTVVYQDITGAMKRADGGHAKDYARRKHESI